MLIEKAKDKLESRNTHPTELSHIYDEIESINYALLSKGK
jgi:hypothetical protein